MPRFIPLILALLLGLALGSAHAPITTRAQTPDPCAPTPTASPAPSATPTATPGGVYLPIIIYEDATAAGWSRSGYSVTIADVTSPAPYSGTKAMRLTYGGWGGVRFTPTGPTSLSGTLSLALRGAGKMRVIVGPNQIGLLTATDAWTVHRLALPGGAVSMIELKNDLSSAATMYVDLVGVEGGGAPTPSPTGAPAGPTRTPTAPPTGGALRVLPLGDSITEGVNGGYRDVLYSRLTTAGYTVDYVGPRYDQYANGPDKDHAGTPGWNSGNVLGAIDGYLATYDPDVVLLLIGTNDLAWWVADATAPADAAARVGQVIDRVQATGARIILATTPPIQDASVPPNGRSRSQLLRDYNAALRTLAAARGVTLVDVEAALTLSDLYDGVHPSEAAHDTKIAPLWAAALGA
jgi:lysophospholipase L1-like esterase